MKKNDFITIFNQLTSSKLADYSLFTDIIENHYEKFKYLYFMIDDIDLNNVNTIYSKASKKHLTTVIVPKNVKYSNSIIYNINDRKNKYPLSEYFNVDLIEEKDGLQISIGLMNNVKEGDIYANRSF